MSPLARPRPVCKLTGAAWAFLHQADRIVPRRARTARIYLAPQPDRGSNAASPAPSARCRGASSRSGHPHQGRADQCVQQECRQRLLEQADHRLEREALPRAAANAQPRTRPGRSRAHVTKGPTVQRKDSCTQPSRLGSFAQPTASALRKRVQQPDAQGSQGLERGTASRMASVRQSGARPMRRASGETKADPPAMGPALSDEGSIKAHWV